MAKGDTVPPLPQNAPKQGELFRHFKGDLYRVVLLALHSNGREWMVIYEPAYEHPAAPFFARPLSEWNEAVDRDGLSVARFSREI